MSDLEQAIIVVMKRRPEIRLVHKGAESFDLAQEHYEDVGLGVFNGFYDFLRSDTGAVIGLRYLPSPDAENVLESVPRSDRIRSVMDGQHRVLLIFWGDDQRFDAETSSDQCFGDNRVYRSTSSGSFAIAFGIDLLSLVERASFVGLAGAILT